MRTSNLITSAILCVILTTHSLNTLAQVTYLDPKAGPDGANVVDAKLTNFGAVWTKVLKSGDGFDVKVGNTMALAGDSATHIRIIDQKTVGATFDYIVLEKREKDPSCPVRYQIIAALDKTQNTNFPNILTKASPEFGSCNDQAVITLDMGKDMHTPKLVVRTSAPEKDTIDTFWTGQLTERYVQGCTNIKPSHGEFLSCNSCELEKRADKALSGIFNRTDPAKLGLQDSTDEFLNNKVVGVLQDDANPNNIKICSGVEDRVVIQTKGTFRPHVVVTNTDLVVLGRN